MKKLILVLFIALSLVACKSTLVINKEDAKEIALDAAGYTEEEVKNLSVSEENGFNVKFISEGGEYQYNIDYDGIISKRNVHSYTDIDSDDVIERKPAVEETVEDEMDEETRTSALNSALTNLGLKENQVKDIEIEKDEDGNVNVICTVIVNGNRFKTVIDSNTGKVVSSFVE